MSNVIVLRPEGTPAEQGSMRPRPIRTGSAKAGTQRITGMRVTHSNPNKLLPWRDEIIRTAHEHMAANDHIRWPITGPTAITVVFDLPRPKAHYRAGRNAHLLKAGAPAWPAKKHDLDKLLRAVLDALTHSGIIADDGLIVTATASKHWAGNPDLFKPGAIIRLNPHEPLELL